MTRSYPITDEELERFGPDYEAAYPPTISLWYNQTDVRGPVDPKPRPEVFISVYTGELTRQLLVASIN